jgi:ADP-ribose pyrophosphatase
MAEPQRETKLASDRMYEGRIVSLDVDQVRLADGRKTVREVVRHAGAAVMLALPSEDRLLLVRQFRYPTGQALWELPAGTLEPGEDARTCAARELQEETGMRAGALHELGQFFSTPGFTDEHLVAMLATELEPAPEGAAPDTDEAIEVAEVAVSEALEMVSKGEIRDAKTLATLMLARLGGWI